MKAPSELQLIMQHLTKSLPWKYMRVLVRVEKKRMVGKKGIKLAFYGL